MKATQLAAVVFLCAMPTMAQQTQVRCRPLVPGDFLSPNESIVGSGDNTIVCAAITPTRAVQGVPVDQPQPQVQPVPVATPQTTIVPAQAAPAAPQGTPAAVQQPAPAAEAQVAPTPVSQRILDGKTRVYITDRPITEVISMYQAASGGTAHASAYGSGNANGFSANYNANAQHASYAAGIKNDQRGGADPRTLEVSSDILHDCHDPNLVVTSNPMTADYVLDFRRQGGKRSTMFLLGGLSGLAISSAMKVDHAALYATNGDLVYASKARTVNGAVRDMCPKIKPAGVTQAQAQPN